MKTECLWVRVKGMVEDNTVGVLYRPPSQEDQIGEALPRQIGDATFLQALVLVGDFNHSDIIWIDNTAGHNQSRRFLEYIGDNYLF